jgi:hypothetical protein
LENLRVTCRIDAILAPSFHDPRFPPPVPWASWGHVQPLQNL